MSNGVVIANFWSGAGKEGHWQTLLVARRHMSGAARMHRSRSCERWAFANKSAHRLAAAAGLTNHWQPTGSLWNTALMPRAAAS